MNSINAIATSNNLAQVKIASREFKANPYPFYARLRTEAPVFRTSLPNKQAAWLITRYDDVMMVLKDEQRFVKNQRSVMSAQQLARQPWVPPMFRPLKQNVLDLDGADHARLRGLVHKAFTPGLIEQMRDRVQVLSNELLDKAERAGKIDLIHDYALPIPLGMISQILGIPANDQDKFHHWTKALIDLSAANHVWRGMPAVLAMMRYLRGIIKERRDKPQDDLITALIDAQESGDHLSDDELLAMVFTLLVAGHETTVNLIGTGTLALLENPDQMLLLRQQPALTRNAIEELLRYVSPVEQATERYAREDVTLHDVTIPKGEMVLAVIASANRDERYFDHADHLDITRENIKHVAFGLGVHYCIGAPLARLEGQIALGTLAQRMPTLHLTTPSDTLRWRPGVTVRGLEALPVAL